MSAMLQTLSLPPQPGCQGQGLGKNARPISLPMKTIIAIFVFFLALPLAQAQTIRQLPFQ
jgi:hypothetical protein